MSRTGFCTMAIHPPYRARARRLVQASLPAPWVVLTDAPEDFADLPVRAVRHEPTGLMAVDYLRRGLATTRGDGAAAYHDKRFALRSALEDFDTAIFLDADSQVRGLPPVARYPAGLAVLTEVESTIGGHLAAFGTWRLPIFVALARELTGDERSIDRARWCHEACFAVTKDGREGRFFDAWALGAGFMEEHEVYSGEGGVIGIAAACAEWATDYTLLAPWANALRHEGGGPKVA